MSESAQIGRRQQRTRQAIRRAFIELATSRRYNDFSVTDLIHSAQIGKSTFYEHYKGKDDVLRALMDGMLEELAQSAGAGVDPARIRGLMAHFWDNRRLGKSVFGPPLGIIVRRRLAELIEAALDARHPASARTHRSRACYIAAGQVGLLYAWVSGEIPADSDEIAAVLAGATS